ncbi:SH3-like domain-containing protein [Streptomyces sp. NPDC004059]
MTSTLRQKRLSATSPTSTPTPRRSGSTTPCRHLAYRCASSAPRRPFTAGKQVRAKTVSAPGHIRLPDCVRGHTGVVEGSRPMKWCSRAGSRNARVSARGVHPLALRAP